VVVDCPVLRKTNWNRFKQVTPRGASMQRAANSYFQRNPTNSSKHKMPDHLAYDPQFVPVVPVLIALHCLTCKTHKVAEMSIPDGVRRPPAIISYQCANCSPKYRHRDAISLAKTAPFAYRSWVAMKDRCFNPRRATWEYYGGRGITICPRWIAPGSGFKNFLQDMGERTKELSIDRIDCDGNYRPGNCRWATQAEQNANRRKPSNYTGTDEEWKESCRKTLEEWARYEAMEDDNTFSGDF
jgi:hypothetical protein